MKIFYLPDLGEGLTEAEIREWYVKEGDTVHVDQPLVSMETAKAILDVPSPYAGRITKLHGQANDIVKTGAPFISYEMEEDQPGKEKGSVVGSLEESTHTWKEDKVLTGAAKKTGPSVKAMPAARVLAKELNVDLHAITGTGPGGLITSGDVKSQLGQTQTLSVLSGPTEKLHGVRRVMAQAMSQSHKEVVPVTIFEEADISDLPLEVDITVCLLKAFVFAAKKEPALNAWFDGKQLERKLFSEVNVGMAVDTSEGLFVPVIKDVGNFSDAELRQKINEYKKTVRARSVSAKEMQGATITLSNFGMIAGKYATPIIIPPTVAILGCGRTREIALLRNGQVEKGRILPLSLSFDHRAVTGGEATRFLGAFIQSLEKNESIN